MEIIKRLNRELVYKGTVINMYRDTVQVQNGHIAEWDFIGHKGAAAVVPVLDDGHGRRLARANRHSAYP